MALEPCDLLIGIRHRTAPCRGYLCEHFVWLKAYSDQDSGSGYSRAANAGAAVNRDALAIENPLCESVDQRNKSVQVAWCRSVFNGKRDELNVVLRCNIRFLRKRQFALLGFLQQRHQRRYAQIGQLGDFVPQPFLGTGARHDREKAILAIYNFVKIRNHLSILNC